MSLFDDEIDWSEVRESIRAEAIKALKSDGWTTASNLKYAVPHATVELAAEVLDSIPGLIQTGDIYSIKQGATEVPAGPKQPTSVEPPRRPARRTNRQGRGIPTPKVPYRELSHGDHALHLNWILESQSLREYAPAHHVALSLSRDMWVDLNRKKHRQQTPGRQSWADPYYAPLDHVQYSTGLGKAAAAKAITHMVECGFFLRRDTGNGGRSGKASGALYSPALPDFREVPRK